MNVFQRTEYVALRLVRRFLFTEGLANKVARWLPYYTTNANEQRPIGVVEGYLRYLKPANVSLTGGSVLEVGAGRTNAVGYGLFRAGAGPVTLLEPFVPFDEDRDTKIRAAIPACAEVDTSKIRRIASFAEISTSSVDILLSNSVLEHVRDLALFFSECSRVLTRGGIMLHLVDYRDHFFKYPYGFLLFEEETWSRWLNPGDLPRWRLDDHMKAMQAHGFNVRVLERATQALAFESVKDKLAARFRNGRQDIDVTFAALLSTRTPSIS